MKLLVIEDEPNLLRVVARTLRKQAFAVDTTDNGEEGLQKAVSEDYDLIVLDVL